MGGGAFGLSEVMLKETNKLVVSFTLPPKQVNRTIYNDALNHTNYCILRTSGVGTYLNVNKVEKGPDAVSFYVYIFPIPDDENTYYSLQVDNIESEMGVPLTSPKSMAFSGFLSNTRDEIVMFAASKSMGLDLMFSHTRGIGVHDGAYQMQSGTAALRKRLLRRYLTPKGAFLHLPNYGCAPNLKSLAHPKYYTDMELLFENETKQEREVKSAKAALTVSGSLATMRVQVTSDYGNDNITQGYEI